MEAILARIESLISSLRHVDTPGGAMLLVGIFLAAFAGWIMFLWGPDALTGNYGFHPETDEERLANKTFSLGTWLTSIAVGILLFIIVAIVKRFAW